MREKNKDGYLINKRLRKNFSCVSEDRQGAKRERKTRQDTYRAVQPLGNYV